MIFENYTQPSQSYQKKYQFSANVWRGDYFFSCHPFPLVDRRLLHTAAANQRQGPESRAKLDFDKYVCAGSCVTGDTGDTLFVQNNFMSLKRI